MAIFVLKQSECARRSGGSLRQQTSGLGLGDRSKTEKAVSWEKVPRIK